jgi:hypothetical protein
MSAPDQAARVEQAKADLQKQINELTYLAREIFETPAMVSFYDSLDDIIRKLEEIRDDL